MRCHIMIPTDPTRLEDGRDDAARTGELTIAGRCGGLTTQEEIPAERHLLDHGEIC